MRHTAVDQGVGEKFNSGLTRIRKPPNPSLEPTRYGRHCKPVLRYSVHCLRPGLQCLPPRSAQLAR
ncbi:hypothetical protein RA210_U280022 [Rubrivivax sp. A210]|nr:hypothetical protein RA210_U280022 [Rubrivivax sp. A210]